MKHITVEPKEQEGFYQKMVQAHGSPLLILDCDQLVKQHNSLATALPSVDFFYAIKALPDYSVIKTLGALGVGFDIASSGEINLLSEHSIQGRKTIHTHPIKRDKDIRDALRFGCTTFVVDNIWELEKFVSYRHRVGLLIRVSFPNSNTLIDLSRKFGCHEDEAPILIQKAQSLGLHIKGLSFHAGSQCSDSRNHVHAIEQCTKIINNVHEFSGKLLSILDIGGGFPVEYIDTLMDINRFCAPIMAALDHVPEHVRIIAEPGRYLCAPAMKSVSSVMGKAMRSGVSWYYMDDGVYGSYSGQLFDHVTYPITVFSDINASEEAVLAGPTCDSIDVIAEQINIPPLLIGDLVVGHQMGAYTSASATNFNLFDRAKIVAINEPVDEPEQVLHLLK